MHACTAEGPVQPRVLVSRHRKRTRQADGTPCDKAYIRVEELFEPDWFLKHCDVVYRGTECIENYEQATALAKLPNVISMLACWHVGWLIILPLELVCRQSARPRMRTRGSNSVASKQAQSNNGHTRRIAVQASTRHPTPYPTAAGGGVSVSEWVTGGKNRLAADMKDQRLDPLDQDPTANPLAGMAHYDVSG